MGFAAGSDTTVFDLVDFATSIAEAWGTWAAPVTSNTCVLQELYFTDLREVDGPTYSYIPPGGIPGEWEQTSCSNQVSLAISFRTPFRGRSFRGRNYLPGLSENLVNNNRVEASWMSAWVSYYAVMFGEANSNLTPMGVISRYRDKVKLDPGSIQPITAILFVDNIVDTQRRRLPKG